MRHYSAVFVESVHESKWMSDLELAMYNSCFDPIVRDHPTLVPHGFIYLRASPETCMRRMLVRSRGEVRRCRLNTSGLTLG